MPDYQDDVMSIPNAPHWLNHSHVEIRPDVLASDQEWIANQTNHVVNPGTQFARIEVSTGSANILLVKRMVVSGVVAVNRPGGRVKTVALPQDADKLLSYDLDYIAEQISALNEPMSAQAQTDFLPSASAPSAGN